MERRQVGFRLKHLPNETTMSPSGLRRRRRVKDSQPSPWAGPSRARWAAGRDVVGVGVQAPQAAARRGPSSVQMVTMRRIVHIRNLRQAKLVRRPAGPGAVLLDGGGIPEPAQRRVEARGRALDAVPCDGVEDEPASSASVRAVSRKSTCSCHASSSSSAVLRASARRTPRLPADGRAYQDGTPAVSASRCHRSRLGTLRTTRQELLPAIRRAERRVVRRGRA